LGKAQAARELYDAGAFESDRFESEESRMDMIDRVTLELEGLLVLAEKVGGWQCDRASKLTGGVLDDLCAPPEPEAEPDWQPAYLNDELDVEARMSWLATDAEVDMSRLLGWKVEQQEWVEGDSPRLKWLDKECRKIWKAEDPLAAAEEWRENPPTPPARLLAA